MVFAVLGSSNEFVKSLFLPLGEALDMEANSPPSGKSTNLKKTIASKFKVDKFKLKSR